MPDNDVVTWTQLTMLLCRIFIFILFIANAWLMFMIGPVPSVMIPGINTLMLALVLAAPWGD